MGSVQWRPVVHLDGAVMQYQVMIDKREAMALAEKEASKTEDAVSYGVQRVAVGSAGGAHA